MCGNLTSHSNVVNDSNFLGYEAAWIDIDANISEQFATSIYHGAGQQHSQYTGADKSLARPGRKQATVSVRMAWISFGALPCRKKTWWKLASRCCWNRTRPWHALELVSFLVGLRTYQHPGISRPTCLCIHAAAYTKKKKRCWYATLLVIPYSLQFASVKCLNTSKTKSLSSTIWGLHLHGYEDYTK